MNYNLMINIEATDMVIANIKIDILIVDINSLADRSTFSFILF